METAKNAGHFRDDGGKIILEIAETKPKKKSCWIFRPLRSMDWNKNSIRGSVIIVKGRTNKGNVLVIDRFPGKESTLHIL